MDDPSHRTITKRNAPSISKPTTVRIGLFFFATGYILLMVFTPDVRPGIMEAVLALALGAVGGWINTRRLPEFLTDLAVYSHTEPWVDWGGFFMRSLPFDSSRACQQSFAGVFFGGYFVLAGVFSLLSWMPSNLGWPWVHPGEYRLFDSMPSAMVLYMLMLFASNFVAMRRWYNSLPD